MSQHFPASWIHGAPDCRTHTGPAFQVHPFDRSTFIFRQSKCVHYEGPFLYLLVGRDTAFLLDSGAAPEDGTQLRVRELVDGILSRLAEERGQEPFRLMVAHSHSHHDHLAGDRALKNRPDTFIVGYDINSIKRAFNIATWPESLGSFDLGGRRLTIIPTPGHYEDHICVYDSATRVLLSGDILYAGKLVINEWRAYLDSAARLAHFARENPLSYILGAHIEMKSTPRQVYSIPTRFQPEEHALELLPSHFEEWAEASSALTATSPPDVHDDFILFPALA